MWRYELKEWKDKTQKQIQFYVDVSNPASYGKFTLPTFKSVSPSHIEQCGEGMQKLGQAIDHITEKVEELKVARAELYVGMTVKLGMREKDDFIQEAIQDLTQIKERCTSSLSALEYKLEDMKKASKGITFPKDDYKKNKQKKANKTKANSRKQLRLKRRIATIMEKFGKMEGDKIEVIDVKKLHKRYDISALKHLLRNDTFYGEAKVQVQKIIKEAEKYEYDSSDNEYDNDD